MSMLRGLALLPLVCLGFGCEGVLKAPAGSAPNDGLQVPGGGPGPVPNASSTNTTPVPNSPVAVAELCSGQQPLLGVQMRRLTPLQYKNSVEAAFGILFADPELPRFQDDNPTIGLANDPQKLRVTTVSIDSVYRSGQAMATRVALEVPQVKDCAAGTSPDCFGEIIEKLGLALWRRPVLAAEKADLLTELAVIEGETGTRSQQAEFLVQALLLSPNMLYRAELGEAAGNLTDYELASLLSFTLWDRPPDTVLLELAAAGSLRNPGVLAAQTARLAGDPKFPAAVAGFFWDYLKLENIRTIKKDAELGLSDPVRLALADSAQQALTRALSSPQATLMQVFSGTGFPVNDDSAPYFGVPAPGSSALQNQMLDATERFGILSHPAFLTSHAGEKSTSIVKRGVFVLEQLLAFDIPAPPPNVAGVDVATLPPSFDPATTSTRDLLLTTHSSQAACKGCHTIIDPAGFGLENFDSAGRYRLKEKGSVPIDASGSLALADETLTYQDSVEFLQALAASKALTRAVLESYFSYALGQSGNGCESNQWSQAVLAAPTNPGGLEELAAKLVMSPSFTARTQL